MGALKKGAGVLVLAIFTLGIVFRPLLTNPAITGGGAETLFQWPQVLLYAPLLALSGLLLVLAVLSVVRGDGLPIGSENREPGSAAGTGKQDRSRAESEFWAEQREKESVWETEDDASKPEDGGDGEPEVPEEYKDHPALASRFLSGQGGAREKGFEIEEEPPDAELSAHLEHLQTALGDDEESREDLETLAEVVEETEKGHEIPERCPQDHCDAVWSGRTVLGMKRERYEVLDNEREVICLECESVHQLDEKPVSDEAEEKSVFDETDEKLPGDSSEDSLRGKDP